MQSFAGLGRRTVESLGLAHGHVITAETTVSAGEALQVMFDNKISGIALVDAEGSIVTAMGQSGPSCVVLCRWRRVRMRGLMQTCARWRLATMTECGRDSSHGYEARHRMQFVTWRASVGARVCS